ncbi:membrane fusion protein (multidrug efflux system) [Pedobacter africanus]|uniref:Membrane fusion protein (Multidrug efflux system) n=1 Tax=Pedobacter africanus TaxID=151894 RepID=A0ACC6KT81_9SPHI|nr:efflux RND transporter periplasmic adaptor subunit [Pedobacter africanus]MDR6782355.1 membrane fusion protein (multidrug efflux system) [Pedobacter africanus]
MLKNTNKLNAVFLQVICGILLISCSNNKAKTEKQTAAPTAGVSKLPVDAIVVNEEPLDQEEMIVGTMAPYREVAIVSEISQKIVQVAFQDGEFVEKGQLLYKLDDADLNARLKGLNSELKLARLNEQRIGNLLKTETVNQQQYDETAVKLHSLEAQRELLQVELNKTAIKAPFSGRIGISNVNPGAFVSPAMELVSLQDQGNIKINFDVSEKYLPLVKTGGKINFTTTLSDQEYTAVVKATEPGLNAQNRALKIQAVTDNPGGKFRSGLSVKIHFPTSKKNAKAIYLPTEALIPSGEGYSVFVLKNGLAKSMPVHIGNRTESAAIIISGLHNGDSVIVSNLLRLGDGMPVQSAVSK